MQRKHDIGEISKAITQYYIDHNGYPAVLSAALTPICNSGTDTSPSCSAGTLDLSALIPDYLTAIPYDPSASTATTTGYSLATNTGGNLYLSAANAELATITLGSSAGVTGEEVGGEESTCDEGCLVLRDHLVVYYALNGDTSDNVGSNDGVWSGTEAYAAGNGDLGQAAVFNGSSYITVPITLTGDNFTMAGWVNFSNSNNNMILRLGDSDSPSLEIYGGWPDGNGFGTWTNPSGSRIQISNINDGGWHHVAVTVDMNTGTMYLYVDGQVRGGTDYYSSISGISQLAIGASVQGSVSSYFTGKIQHVGVWDKMLTDLEIADLYFEGNGYSLVQ